MKAGSNAAGFFARRLSWRRCGVQRWIGFAKIFTGMDLVTREDFGWWPLVGPAGTKTGEITNKVVEGVQRLLRPDPRRGQEMADVIISLFAGDPKMARRVAEAQLIREALERGAYTVIK